MDLFGCEVLCCQSAREGEAESRGLLFIRNRSSRSAMIEATRASPVNKGLQSSDLSGEQFDEQRKPITEREALK